MRYKKCVNCGHSIYGIDYFIPLNSGKGKIEPLCESCYENLQNERTIELICPKCGNQTKIYDDGLEKNMEKLCPKCKNKLLPDYEKLKEVFE